MKDTFEIYVQKGLYGWHAAGRGRGRTYGIHAHDQTTAAWRCALKYWFPSRPNSVVLYEEARAVTVRNIGPNEFSAALDMPDETARGMEFAKPIQALMGQLLPVAKPQGPRRLAAPVPVAAGGTKTKTAKTSRAEKRTDGKGRK